MNDFLEVMGVGLSATLFFGVIFGFLAFRRYLQYKETIKLAEQGLLRPSRRRKNRDALRWGVVITVMGIGLTCSLFFLGFALDPATAPRTSLGFGPWMLIGILPFFFGLSLIAVHYVTKREGKDELAEVDESVPPHKRDDQ